MDRVQAADEPIVLPFMTSHTSEIPPVRRLPGSRYIPDPYRAHVVSMLGEFIGTFLFLFFAFAGTQVANASAAATSAFYAGMAYPLNEMAEAPNVGVLLYIALAFGFSLMVNVWVFFRISGGAFNPAVTFALCLIGASGWLRGFLVIVSQILGAIAAAAVVQGLFPGPMAVRTRLSAIPATSIARGVFIEMFLTAMLVFTILMLAIEKSKATFLAPVGIGLALFIAELAGILFTGGSLNPARSFGPDVVLGQFDGYHWMYWVGPALGSIVAVLFYRLVKILEYETANPGADADRRMSAIQSDREGDYMPKGQWPAAPVGNDGYFPPTGVDKRNEPIEMRSWTAPYHQPQGNTIPATPPAAAKRLGFEDTRRPSFRDGDIRRRLPD